jgi:HEAT repeat protein
VWSLHAAERGIILSRRSESQTEAPLRVLKRRGDVAGLLRYLDDPEFAGVAATYLADLDADEASPKLICLLSDKDPHLRARAARALGRLQAKTALPKLREMAFDEKEQDWARSWALGAIGEMG